MKNWIRKMLWRLKSPEQQKKSYESMLQNARVECCKYTEHPFSTDMRNYMQRVKIESSPTGWGVKMLEVDEVKRRLDSGLCWIDYPALNQDGTEIEGVTGKDFGS